VTLADIADVSGVAQGQVSELRQLPLGQIGGGSVAVTLERAGIARWVCGKGWLCGGQVVWRGAETVEVRRLLRPVSRDSLVAPARQALERALAPLGARLLIKEVAGQGMVDLPPGRLSFAARPLPAGAVPGKRMLVWVDVAADGRFVRAVPVRFEVAALVPGWLARGPLAAGARVTAEQFRPGEVDLTEASRPATIRRREDAFVAAGEIWVIRHDMRPGQAMTWKNSSPAPLVVRGEQATLRMGGTSIALESRVEVLQDGFLGQTVKVKAMQATGAVLATVTGPGLVEARN